MKKVFWIILLMILLPLAPFPVIVGLISYSFIRKQQKQGNPWFQSDFQKSFSTSFSWPPKTNPHSPSPAPIHVHRENRLHHHKKFNASNQELHLRLGILLVGAALIALLFILR